MAETETEITIADGTDPNKKLWILVASHENGISICPDGYGDFSSEAGFGCPIYIELYEGKLRLVLHTDINEQEPTIIDMSGALESNRKS